MWYAPTRQRRQARRGSGGRGCVLARPDIPPPRTTLCFRDVDQGGSSSAHDEELFPDVTSPVRRCGPNSGGLCVCCWQSTTRLVIGLSRECICATRAPVQPPREISHPLLLYLFLLAKALPTVFDDIRAISSILGGGERFRRFTGPVVLSGSTS
jgi:hypothetical protein